jgi:hypothetical protein
MKLNRLLRLQLLYCAAGLAYNLASLSVVLRGGEPLATTSPVLGAAFMLLYGVCLLPGRMGQLGLYRILMAVFLLVGGYGGIAVHLIDFSRDPTLYASPVAWFLAVAINGFGWILNGLAALGRFGDDGRETTR